MRWVNKEMGGWEIAGKPELLTLDDDTNLGEFSDEWLETTKVGVNFNPETVHRVSLS